ncbi:hypothetical protein D9M71_814130 [compost metagenome]
MVRLCHSISPSVRPDAVFSVSTSATWGWWLYITWNNGLWLKLRSSFSASTSCSNGRSWWAWAPRAVSLIARNNSLTRVCPFKRVRSTWVLTKKPIRPSTSARLRLAMGTPTRMSVCPV